MPKIYKRNCDICGNSYIGKGKRFCSRKCYYKSKINSKHTEEWKRNASERILKRKEKLGYINSPKTRKRISKSNKKTFLNGRIVWNKGKTHMAKENNPNWKGKRNYGRYLGIYKPNHPFTTKSGHIREHRLVVEKCIGRYLEPTEIVHHINNNGRDNRPKNLYLFSSRNEHMKFHNLLLLIDKFNPVIEQKLPKPKIKSNLI